MARPFEIKHHRRIVAMIIFVSVIFLFAAMRAFQFQLVEGASLLATANKSSDSTIVVTAARGEIVDRNGVPLTKNKATFNVEFDYNFMKKRSADETLSTQNQTIYDLIRLFEKRNEKWIDELPITTNKPYKFIDGKEMEVAKLKTKIGVNQYTTAQDCIDNIYEEYKIKDYSEDYKRKVAGVRYQMLFKDFSRYTPRYTFAEDITPQTVAFMKEFSSDLIGVEIVEKAIRTYVSGDVASHIIGSLGPIYAEEAKYYKDKGYPMTDLVGKDGIEKALEDVLRGQNGTMKVIKNSKGEIIDIQEETAPVAGRTVQLTLDLNFQKEVQTILADYIKDFNETNKEGKKAEGSSIVVMDVKTGGVLASISYPYYDINEYKTNYSELLKKEGNPLFNRAMFGLYRPGSTFKPVVAAAALTENKITPQTTVFCDGVYHFWDDYQPKCLSIGHRNVSLNVISALDHSCNVFFYETGRLLGIDKINEYANYFGLGAETGLELSNATGNLSSPAFSAKYDKRWEKGNVVQAAIGQMDTSVTPLQMAIESMTIANKGTRYNAHLVKNILSNDMKQVITPEQIKVASSFKMSDITFDTIKQGMIAASKGVGAPNQLTDLGYDVAVKTGTPQVSPTKTNNAFIAFSPAASPEIAISCMVEDGYGTNKLIRRILLAYEKSKIKPVQ